MSDFRNIDVQRWPTDRVRIVWERITHDDCDASPNDYLFQDEDYREEDQARLDAFNRGDWSFIGIQAKATLYVPIGQGSFVIHEMTSAGLWAIESDSEEDFLKETFEDEKASLLSTLKTLGTCIAEDKLDQEG